MAIMIGCGVLLLAGLVAGVRWSAASFAAPDPGVVLTAGEVTRRYIWYSSIVLTAGIFAGITVIGAGGRLAMRLLAVTSGDAAQGRITEASEVVGEITTDGTIGFVLFNGVIGGVLFGALFLVVRRFLPAGPWGGVVFGLGLLIVFGSILDPLRRQNRDFDIIGPGWVAVVVFALLATVYGLALEGCTARMSSWLPQPATQRRVLVRYAGPGVIAAVAYAVTILLAVVGALTALVTRWNVVIDVVRSSRWVTGGRILLINLVLASLPNTLTNVIDIAGR